MTASHLKMEVQAISETLFIANIFQTVNYVKYSVPVIDLFEILLVAVSADKTE
jgi:hypothetical protein